MDTQQLKAFVDIAQLGSFSLAAQKLCITQPAISKRIASLENNLGYHLFDRSSRQTRLTEAGHIFLPHARLIMLQLDQAKSMLNDFSGSVQGTLHLTTSHHIGLHRLPKKLKEYHQDYPKVQLQLNFLDSESALRQVIQNNTQLALITLPESIPSGLEAIPLWEDRLHFVVAKDHPLAAIQTPTLELLSQYPAILPDLSSYTARLIKPLFDAKNLPLDIMLASNFLETLQMMVSVGLGWSLLPEILMKESDLTTMPIENTSIKRSLGLVYTKNKHLSRAAKALIHTLSPETSSEAH